MNPIRERLRSWLIAAEKSGEISTRFKALMWLMAIEVSDGALESFMDTLGLK